MKKSTNKPTAVLISDIHYNIHTLPLADAALRQAVNKANALNVPLIVAGDLHDTKANLRGECVNAMLETLGQVDITLDYEDRPLLRTYVIVGNHDLINEKGKSNSLNCLAGIATIVSSPSFYNELGAVNGMSVHLIPYYSNTDELRAYLKKVDKGSTIIMHQGLEGSDGGEYIQDKSAIRPEDVGGMRVISGHYHKRQDIKLPNDGLWSYIGNPYTLTYGESGDSQKGYQVLYNDGTLQFEPTNLRKHVLLDLTVKNLTKPRVLAHKAGDLLKIRLSGTAEELSQVNKQKATEALGLPTTDWVLEMEPIGSASAAPKTTKQLSDTELLDSLIDSLTNVSEEQKIRLKTLYKEI